MVDKIRIGLFHAASWTARLLLLAIVTIVPWCYGGAQWQVQLAVLYAGLVLATLTWVTTLLSPRRTGACIRLAYCMVAFMCIAAIQLLPMPAWLAQRASSAHRFTEQAAAEWSQLSHQQPQNAQGQDDRSGASVDRPLWLDSKRHNTLSILPVQTCASLAVFAVATTVVWSASVLFVSTRWAIVLAITLAAGGFLNGFLGLMQAVAHGDWTLLPMPSSDTCFSTFVSRNSAPGYFATALGSTFALLGIAFRSQKRKRRQEYRVTYGETSLLGRLRNRMEDVFIDLNTLAVTCISLAAFLLVATLATYSRGGAIACLGACLVTLCLTLGSRGELTRATAIAAGLVVLVAAFLTFFELDVGLRSRFEDNNGAAQSSEDARIDAWTYTLQSLSSYWFGGSGLGTYRFAILPFHTKGPNVWFHHAENMPLEIAAETGLLGLLVAGIAFALVLRQIHFQNGSDKESLLLVGVTFATCALAIQSLVDFNLVLPGVFLPYCALLGAFMGRCRRIATERHRVKVLGDDAFDARRTARAVHGSHEKHVHRSILNSPGHTVVAVACLAAGWLGWSSLRGYAAAERVGAASERFEKLITPLSSGESSASAADVQLQGSELALAVQLATDRFPGHAEVELQAGKAAQMLWHSHAIDSLEWGEYSYADRWKLANPQVLTLIMRSPSPDLAPVRAAINEDVEGLEMVRRGFGHLQLALGACPMDARAVWGVINSDARWLSAPAHRSALRLLSKLVGNNSRMLAEAGITALQEGLAEEGFALFERAVGLDETRLAENVDAVVGVLSPEQLLALLPDDLVEVAQMAQRLSRTLPGHPTSMRLSEHAYKELQSYEDLPFALANRQEEWQALAWVARQQKDEQLQIKVLQRAVSGAAGSAALLYELAQVLYSAGRLNEAREQLDECIRREPTNAVYLEQKKKWSESVDPKR